MTDQDARLKATERAIEVIVSYLHATQGERFGQHVDQDTAIKDAGLENTPAHMRDGVMLIRHHLQNLLVAGR